VLASAESPLSVRKRVVSIADSVFRVVILLFLLGVCCSPTCFSCCDSVLLVGGAC
jgi:hypothetical protein